MHVKRTDKDDTTVSLLISAEEAALEPIKTKVLQKLSSGVKLQGFRQGKAPLSLVEKSVDQSVLQTEFLDEAMTQLYTDAAQAENIRPVTRPNVEVKKFVPFTSLEFEVITQIIGRVKLPDYKKIKVPKEAVKVTEKEVDEVVSSLKTRLAEKKDVDRPAKAKDQVWIDFKGDDAKGQPVSGAEGKDYPLMLGSSTFIPGFEDNLIGVKPGEEKIFTLTFPKEYGVKALANKKVTFTVTVTKVQEVVEPKEDAEFAAKAGPFKSMDELKEDIKKQLQVEKERDAEGRHQEETVKQVVDKSKVAIPEPLVEQQIIYNIDELRRNLTYRGQTYQEFLEAEGLTEEQYKEKVRPIALNQIKTSVILTEIADKEKITVMPEELEIRIQLLKGQYQDPAMQAELEKPENRRDISSRMLTEKVVNLLTNKQVEAGS